MNKFFFLLFLLFFLISPNAYSNDQNIQAKTKIYAGGGFISKPTYEGSSSRRFMWIPMIALQYSDNSKRFLNSFDFYGPYASLGIYSDDIFSIKLFSMYDFGRQNGDDNSLAGLEEIDPHFQNGIELDFSLPFDFSIGYSIVTDTKDFYSGSYDSKISLNHKKLIWINFKQPLINAASISTNYANSDYLNEWFGTPYPAFSDPNAMYQFYKPGAGFYKISFSNNVIFPLNEKVKGFIDLSYDRLTGDAGDSQLVKRQGSKNQFGLMFNALYEFYSF